MSLHLFEKLNYSEDDWCIMKNAHIMSCELLGQSPRSYEYNERLARSVMNLFNDGIRDYYVLALVAARRETDQIRLAATYH